MNIFQEAKSVLDKDGKVNALGPFGKSKLSGREVSTYFRRNKVKDATIRKAVEVALDLGGAMDIASREIKKFYGDKILKSKEVQNALKYANEEAVLSVKEDLQEVALDQNMLQRQFPNVWATKDSKLYRVLSSLISFHGYNDNVKSYKKNPKAFIDSLRSIAKNPGKHRELGPNFKQYIEKPKKGQAFAEAVSPAQQAAIAISKKEKGEKPKNEDAEDKAKLALKHAQEKEKLDQKHKREKEQMSESNDMNVDKAPKNKWKALGFSQHPHKGFEGERMPKGMRDFRKKAITPTDLMKKKMNVMDSYRAMWEEGQKYAPTQELPEQNLQEKDKMTSAQKKEFDKLYKKMDGGKEHQAIKRKIKNPVKADDAFHSLVMKKVLGEKLSATDLKFIDMMYDKKGKLTDVGKAVMNYKPGDNIRKIVQNLNNKK